MDQTQYNGRRREEKAKYSSWGPQMGLRFIALLLTLLAAVVLGVDKQTEVVPISLSSSLPPLYVPVTAKWRYLSAFSYFVVANSIACVHAAISLVTTLLSKRTGGGSGGAAVVATALMDIVSVALLFSGIGAAGAVGLIGYKGNSHVRWNKVCNVFDKFCHQVMAAVALSLLGSIAFVLLVLLAVFNLSRRSSM